MTDSKFGFSVAEDVISGDFVFDAFGVTIEDLFKACAMACFHAMTELKQVEPQIEHNLNVNGDDLNELLYNFLAELIYLKDTEKSFFSHFEIKISDDKKSLKASIRGEAINYNKHIVKTDVKAVTYHGLNISEQDGKYIVRIILDL